MAPVRPGDGRLVLVALPVVRVGALPRRVLRRATATRAISPHPPPGEPGSRRPMTGCETGTSRVHSDGRVVRTGAGTEAQRKETHGFMRS